MNATEATTLFEIRGIQSFVFQTGRQRDTVGRSAYLGRLTDPDEIPLRDLLQRHGVRQTDRRPNGFSIVGDPDDQRAFTAGFTRILAEQAPSLRLTVVKDPASPTLDLARTRLQQADSSPNPPPLGVVRCALTETVATVVWPSGVPTESDAPENWSRRRIPVAREVLTARTEGQVWLQRFAAEIGLPQHLVLTTEMDDVAPDLGRSTKVATVTADINGLGSALQEWHGLGRTEDAHGMLRAGIRELMIHLVRCVAGWSSTHEGREFTAGAPTRLNFPLATPPDGSDSPRALPIQPTIVGGDDLAFVCESRLAWSLVDELLRYASAPPSGSGLAQLAELGAPFANDEGQLDLTFRVGIAVASRGYALDTAHLAAEQLMNHARTAHRFFSTLDPVNRHHAVAWSLLSDRSSTAERTQKPTVYVRPANGDPHASEWVAQRGVEPLEIWSKLLGLLDPGSPGSIRSPQADGSLSPWTEQRAELKSLLAGRLLLLPKNPDERASILRKISQSLRSRGPALSGLGPELNEHSARLLADAISLLDEHLTMPEYADRSQESQ